MDLFIWSHYQEILRRFEKKYNYKYIYQLAPNYDFIILISIHSRFVKSIQMYFFA